MKTNQKMMLLGVAVATLLSLQSCSKTIITPKQDLKITHVKSQDIPNDSVSGPFEFMVSLPYDAFLGVKYWQGDVVFTSSEFGTHDILVTFNATISRGMFFPLIHGQYTVRMSFATTFPDMHNVIQHQYYIVNESLTNYGTIYNLVPHSAVFVSATLAP